jgi:hypothetical protein
MSNIKFQMSNGRLKVGRMVAGKLGMGRMVTGGGREYPIPNTQYLIPNTKEGSGLLKIITGR